ncbi:MAG: vitamin K epoxide reductase family protein [Candidatus Velthaea sp.]
MLGEAVTVWLLSGIGVYASAVMFGKARRAARGQLTEPSVVQTPAARAIGGVSNAAFGLVYYPLVAVGATIGRTLPAAAWTTLAAATLAAVFSAYLAYSLLFRTRRACPFCWTGHACNWALWCLSLHLALTR